METYVYADVIIIENLVMNYFILWSTAKLARVTYSRLKFVFASLAGAIYAVFNYFPDYGYLYSILMKFTFSLLIIVIAFTPGKVKEFIRLTGIFYIISFVFGGAAFGFYYFINGAGLLKDGVFYIGGFPAKLLLISSLAAYLMIKYCWDYVQYRIKRERIITKLNILFENKNATLTALVDTGNSLNDPISNAPVIVVEYLSIRELLPRDIQRIFDENKEDNFYAIARIMTESSWVSRFRVIPFKSLGRENGMIIGFKPDEVNIIDKSERKNIKNIIVGIYNKKLSNDGEYSALVHPDIIK